MGYADKLAKSYSWVMHPDVHIYAKSYIWARHNNFLKSHIYVNHLGIVY